MDASDDPLPAPATSDSAPAAPEAAAPPDAASVPEAAPPEEPVGCPGEAINPGLPHDGRDLLTLTTIPYASRVLVDDTDAFIAILANGNVAPAGILAVPKTGGEKRMLASNHEVAAWTQDRQNLYWVNRGVFVPAVGRDPAPVMMMAKNAGPPVTLAASQPAPSGIALEGGVLYWINMGTMPTNFHDGSIWRITPGQAGAAPRMLTSQRSMPRQLAVKEGRLYWFEQLGLTTMSVEGGPPPKMISNETSTFLAVDCRHAYVAWDTGKIWRVPITGGPSVLLADRGGELKGLAIDAGFVYWAVSSELPVAGYGQVFKISKQGGQPVIIAQGQGQARAVTVDADHVYWLANARLMKALK